MPKPVVRTTLSLPPEVAEEIHRLAAGRNVTVSEWLRRAIDNQLWKERTPPGKK